ncbi:MAG TPA: AFG1/ZapE family ATPase, partial [Trueperaceae bacterium]
MPNAVPHERPHLQLPAFVPPPRFGATSFETYQPQHPSQQAALARVRAFAAETAPTKAGFRWPWQSRHAPGRGLYLDGGFGVGKTHLLAATYHASAVQDKAYLSFQELVYAIGVLGMDRANRELAYQLYCIDEFELDDPGNTLIVKTFLAHAFARGALVLTTSNTPPEAQGQGRFNAE